MKKIKINNKEYFKDFAENIYRLEIDGKCIHNKKCKYIDFNKIKIIYG